jgi:hypothetical protein
MFDRAAPFLAALSELASREELDSLSGNIYPRGPRETRYELNALVFDGSEAVMTRRLPPMENEVSRSYTEIGYLDYCLQVDQLLERLAAGAGGWQGVAHPWFDAFLPASRFQDFLEEVLPTLNPTLDVGPAALGPLAQIHVFPLLTRYLRKPLLRVPNEPLVYLLDLLTSGYQVGSTTKYQEEMLARNRRLFALARSLGGTRYNITAVPMTTATWCDELGGAFAAFAAQKCVHDPANILGSLSE